MKIHKLIYFFLFIFFPLFIFGCAKSVDMSKHLITLNYNYFQGSSTPKEKNIRFYPADRTLAKLEAANDQIENKLQVGPLPVFIAKNPLISKTIQAVYQSLRKPQVRSIKIKMNDIQSMNTMIAESFGAGASKQGNDVENEDSSILIKIKTYLMTYYIDENGFIDRNGTTYKPPERMEGIGNEVITATFAILLEAVFDELIDMPVFVNKDGKIETRTKKIPTVYSAGFIKEEDKEKIVPRGQPGIEDLELKAIWYLSGLAADQSKALSGAVYRLFGNLELGVVFVGADFSVGENDTIAKILDTIFEVVARRTVEMASFMGFKHATALVRGKTPETPAEKLISDLARLYPEKK